MTNYEKLIKYCKIEKNSLVCVEPLYIELPKNKYDTEEANIDISEESGEEDFAGIVKIPIIIQKIITETPAHLNAFFSCAVNSL